MEVVSWEELVAGGEPLLEATRRAFVGDAAYGVVGVRGVPGFRAARRAWFDAAAGLATGDERRRAAVAAVRQTYPGWSGTPRKETHPLQSNFLHNVKQEIGNGAVDPFFGANVWPSQEVREAAVNVNECMYDAALRVMAGCDELMRSEHGELPPGRHSMHDIATRGTTLAGRWILYDSAFSRNDSLLHERDGTGSRETHPPPAAPTTGAGHGEDSLASMRTHATAVRTTGAGHGEDSLASMRTHATAVRTTGSVEAGGADAAATAVGESLGEYWLPWHIDSQFITLLAGDDFVDERDGTRAAPPAQRAGAGLIAMNERGDVVSVAEQQDDDVMLVQMGGFAQIYSGGFLRACRHAVVRTSANDPGVGRISYCCFWYAPWDLPCTMPEHATADAAVNSGWNAMMDATYVDITMRRSFSVFRRFFTSLPVANEHDPHNQPGSTFARLAEALPTPRGAGVVVDVLTDIRCPYSHIALRRLARAVARLPQGVDVTMRYFPVYLDPDVPEEGEDLDAYLLREHGVTPEEARSPAYELTVLGAEVGVRFSMERRVVNTRAAFCALEAARPAGLQHELFEELSRRYFEEAQDISRPVVLREAAVAVGLADPGEDATDAAAARVDAVYGALREIVPRVPHLLVRDAATGEGVETVGASSVDALERSLRRVLSPSRSALAGVHDLARPAGALVAGHGGEDVRVAHGDPRSVVTLHVPSRRGWYAPAWPYTAADMARADESDDALTYAEPRFVTHLDGAALASLTGLYRALFGAARRRAPGGEPLALLDTCSSWVSHYPDELLDGCRVAVQGLNAAELEANAQRTEAPVVCDLNRDQALPYADDSFDFVTNVSSVDYLTRPREVVAECRRVLKPGGVLVLAFSDRCFDSKAVSVWLRRIDEGAALAAYCADALHFAEPIGAWSRVSSVDLSPGGASDPLWALLAVK